MCIILQRCQLIYCIMMKTSTKDAAVTGSRGDEKMITGILTADTDIAGLIVIPLIRLIGNLLRAEHYDMQESVQVVSLELLLIFEC